MSEGRFEPTTIDKARGLLDKVSDIGGGAPADLTYREVVRMAKAWDQMTELLSDLCDELEEAQCTLAELEDCEDDEDEAGVEVGSETDD